MRLFLCGKGAGLAAILEETGRLGWDVCLFCPDAALADAVRRCGQLASAESVNQWHLWPWKPDLIVSCGCLDILTPAVLDRVGGMAINCHYALLPNHRGRSAVPWAILDGDNVAGITWHWIDPSIDTGDMLLQMTCQIAEQETATTLFEKLHRLAFETWTAAGLLAMRGTPGSGVPQRGGGRYHKAGPPFGGVIEPAWPDEYVERFIRAMTYPPLPYATFEGVEVKTFADYKLMRLAYERYHRHAA